tara:strand:+ start:763 stop:1128 length:366 start_codon:yes stop_codon:yes gene_type:complete
MIEIPVSLGELYDKFSILEIKKQKGLDVEKELNLLKEKLLLTEDTNRIAGSFYACLKTVNTLLWDIEDDKRQHEADQDFGETFIELARLVYILNDHRALLKKHINKYSNSEITEEKKHSEY